MSVSTRVEEPLKAAEVPRPPPVPPLVLESGHTSTASMACDPLFEGAAPARDTHDPYLPEEATEVSAAAA